MDYFAPNGYGLYDMAGNVTQWCWDWAASYGSTPQIDPCGPSTVLDSDKMMRGGNSGNNEFWLHCSSRYKFYGPAYCDYGTGFRSVLAPAH